ncbi:MAG: hypothetical protein OIF50_08990 [Flavobacteriaceae bacterium]|nr:hypothetical protein [Flavobacteriaceae bacterium]
MKPIYKILSTIVLISGIYSCSSDFEPVNDLEKVALQAPLDKQECFGIILPNGNIQVRFQWNNIDANITYSLEYTNTKTKETKVVSTSSPSIQIELAPGVMYTWKVMAKDSQGNNSNSETFSFYTQGLSIQHHVPFPASLDIQDNGDGNATLSWVGSDLDEDIQYYNVFFGTQDPPAKIMDKTNASTTTAAVQSGNTYIFMVQTVDTQGNYSNASIRKSF